MKTISKIFLSATLLCVLISCSDDSEDGPVAPEGKMIATIDGVAWEVEATATVRHDFEYIHVVARKDTKELWVMVDKDDAVGTYEVTGYSDMAGPASDAAVTYNTSSTEGSSSVFCEMHVVVGSVTITEIDETNRTVSGTFHSKVKHNITKASGEITKGSFTKIPF